jgi:hypothetical protein
MINQHASSTRKVTRQASVLYLSVTYFLVALQRLDMPVPLSLFLFILPPFRIFILVGMKEIKL